MLNRWQKTIVDERGNVVPWAVLIIRKESDQMPATVYRDRNGTDLYPAGQVVADGNGFAYFYAAPGLYRITSQSPVADWRDVGIGEPFDSSALGTAAAHDVQESTTDTTLGRVVTTNALWAGAAVVVDGIGSSIRYPGHPVPSLDLVFGYGASKLDPRITFTRASTGTYFDALGVLRTAGVGEPRFDYDPETGEPLGLLIEAQATNEIKYSEALGESTWDKTNVSVSIASEVNPAGAPHTYKITETTSTATHDVSATTTGSAHTGSKLTSAVFARAAERHQIQIRWHGGETGETDAYANFDLITGEVSYNCEKAFTVRLRGGWWLCVAEVTVVGTGSNRAVGFGLLQSLNQGRRPTYAGDGISGVYLWGAHQFNGTGLSSYIKTESTQVTRAADSAAVTDVSGWYNPTAGSIVVNWEPSGIAGAARGMWWLNNAVIPRGIGLRYTTPDDVQCEHRDDTGTNLTSPEQPVRQGRNICASAFSSARVAISTNGAAVQSSLGSTQTPTITRLDIGVSNVSGSDRGPFVGWVRSLQYYPRTLTDAQLQALTS